ncbi:MAG: CopG family transcriptional regulator [Bradyrhizobiaceae bacterium]|nr:MAG: CopG family transcriptional regulator [Bradyrhizobiaceae bacterium]
MKRRTFCIGCLLAAISPALSAVAAEPIRATLYKNPQCTCCEGYATYLRSNGFEVDVRPTNDLNQISQKAGVPEKYQGCHTMFVGGYVVDGHVPVETVRKLLSERPKIAGITLPGMPIGSPGMYGKKTQPFVIYAVTKDGKAPTVYAEV